jgi:hypothetical protein
MIGRIRGSTTLHQASRAQMHCVVQCLDATIFNWSTTMLTCMKKRLTDCHRRMNKNFRFGTMLCAFLFERVSSLSLRETTRGHITSFPSLCRWEAFLPRQGGGRVHEAFDDKFFDWWAHQILIIEDYPYARISFLRMPKMPMPPGEEHGEIGKHIFKVI